MIKGRCKMKEYQVWTFVEAFNTKKEAVDFVELNYEPSEFTKIITKEIKEEK